MIPRAHQTVGAAWALDTIRKHGLAYLSWKERTGKTLTALLTAEHSKMKNILIVTKKKAIPGWTDTLKEWKHVKNYSVINYESIHKLDPTSFDFIILDESHHAISGIGKPSKTWHTVKGFTKGKPILYLSATPYAEHIGLIYPQLKLSDWNPLRFTNFYNFFRRYGVPHKTRTPYGLQETYTKYKTEEVLKQIEHLFNFKTRADVGIEHEPTVKVVKIKPSVSTLKLLQDWTTDRVIVVKGHEVLGDSDPKVRTVHYQIEGGTVKVDDKITVSIGNTEKINYIQDTYKEEDIAIMAHFIGERNLLRAYFPEVPIYSSDGDAEGVDLSHIKKLIIYSMSFKTSKHTQRVARQANHERTTPIEVDVLTFDKPGIGYSVYKAVAIKETNFIKASYERAIC